MQYLLTFLTAIAISMALIPLMIRLAPRLRLIDKPDPRKVHAVPIPRAGGVGIVLGALVPLLLWMPLDDSLRLYLFGSAVLLAFGLWDDSHELGHYVKFIGQFLAVIPVVYVGDVYVTQIPLLAEPLSADAGRVFTVIAMVGMINAINHSDGLDGLAGGMSVMSLICIATLAWQAEGYAIVEIVVATLGGVFGFLRYNTHPARVFMGDSGSQFLGFTLGYVAIVLTQQVNPALSPALPALILGLPIVDILAVFYLRISGGMNWFRATRNHIHHRFLALNFHHYEVVVIIYSAQALLVTSAVLFPYENDTLILATYAVVCVAIFSFLMVAEQGGWRIRRHRKKSRLEMLTARAMKAPLLMGAPTRLVEAAIAVIFLAVAVSLQSVPVDFGIGAAALALVLVLFIVFHGEPESLVIRAIHYVTATFVVYLANHLLISTWPVWADLELALFIALAVMIALAARLDARAGFQTTPTDYLIVFLAIAAGAMSAYGLIETRHVAMVVKIVILFYGCEMVLSRARKHWNILSSATLASLLVLGVRGLLAV